MQHIRGLLESFAPLSDDDWYVFKSKLVFQDCPKKSIILEQGATENYLSFIESGVVRLYIPKIDNDLTFGFAFAQSFVSGYDSFLTQTPCTYQIQSITQTKLWRVSYSNLQAIYKETSIGNEIGRKNAENLFLIKSKRELALLNKSAKERYLELFSERPELIREIPLKYIASYIGITPQALSRIRRQIS